MEATITHYLMVQMDPRPKSHLEHPRHAGSRGGHHAVGGVDWLATGGTDGQRARDAEGKAGSLTDPHTSGKLAVKKTSDGAPMLSRAEAMEDARSFGMAGMLASLAVPAARNASARRMRNQRTVQSLAPLLD